MPGLPSVHDFDHLRNKAIITALAAGTGVDEELIRASTMERYERALLGARHRPTHNRTPLLRVKAAWDPIGQLHSPFCWKCVAEFGYFRREWRLAFITACPIHMIVLSDYCKSCIDALGYANVDIRKSGTKPRLCDLHSKGTEHRDAVKLTLPAQEKFLSILHAPDDTESVTMFFKGLNILLDFHRVTLARIDSAEFRFSYFGSDLTKISNLRGRWLGYLNRVGLPISIAALTDFDEFLDICSSMGKKIARIANPEYYLVNQSNFWRRGCIDASKVTGANPFIERFLRLWRKNEMRFVLPWDYSRVHQLGRPRSKAA